MPIEYQRHPGVKLATLKLIGQCDLRHFMATFEFIAQDPDLLTPKDHKVFWDMSRLTQSDIGFSEARILALRLERGFSGVVPRPVARIKYAPTEFSFGMARLLERSVQENMNIRRGVYENFDQACDALGVPPDEMRGVLDRPHVTFQ